VTASGSIAFKPRKIEDLDRAFDWLAHRIQMQNAVPRSVDGVLVNHIIESIPKSPVVLRDAVDGDTLTVHMMLPSDSYDEVWAKISVEPPASTPIHSLPERLPSATVDEFELVLSEFEKPGYLSWDQFNQWRQQRVGC